MKKIILLGVGLCVAMRLECAAQQSFLYDYESPSNSAGYVGIGASFGLSLTTVADGQNNYGHYVVTNFNSGTGPNSQWYAGAAAVLGNVIRPYTVPNQWEVDFDIRHDVIEPVRVELEIQSQNQASIAYTAWVTPPSSGWEHITLTSDQFSLGPGEFPPSGFGTNVYLFITLASVDSLGNPLSLYNPGTYTMDMDNIAFAPIPEPGIGLIVLGAICFGLSRVQNKSKAIPPC